MTIRKSKKFKFEDYWAESIQRKRYEGKDVIFAYVRRFHSYDDVNMENEGQWIGLNEKPIHQMTVDKDEDSDTYTQRIPLTNDVYAQDGTVTKIPVIRGTKYEYTFEANEKNIKDFKKLYRDTIHGTTCLTWCLNPKNYTCEYQDDFWVTELKDVEESLRKRRSIRTDVSESG